MNYIEKKIEEDNNYNKHKGALISNNVFVLDNKKIYNLVSLS